MDNMELWNEVKAVPADAQKKITGGRLQGMTDIKPQWRLQVLTKHFGPCGVGWYYESESWIETYKGDTVSAHVKIRLYVLFAGEWSRPIEGQGGSMLVAKEKAGPYHSDEAFKMATTDALSVACKQLGIGADVYLGHPFGKGEDKYKEFADGLRGCKTLQDLSEYWSSVYKNLEGDNEGRKYLTGVKDACKVDL